jgi:predicted glutamine amidotransferase/uncharacterized protein with PIN domain
MCGIFGAVNLRETQFDLYPYIKELGIRSLNRGADAGGLAWYDKTGMRYIKKPGPISQLFKGFKKPALKSLRSSSMIIGHTRLATQGSAQFNRNNHPLIKNNLALVHNGIVWDDDLRDAFKCEAEVDSEVILLAIRSFAAGLNKAPTNGDSPIEYGIKEAMNLITGQATCALLDANTPHLLYLWSSGPPVHLAFLKDKRLLLFASEADTLRKTISHTIMGFFDVMPRCLSQDVATDSLLTIDTQAFKIRQRRLTRPAFEYYEGYTYRDSSTVGKKDTPYLRWCSTCKDVVKPVEYMVVADGKGGPQTQAERCPDCGTKFWTSMRYDLYRDFGAKEKQKQKTAEKKRQKAKAKADKAAEEGVSDYSPAVNYRCPGCSHWVGTIYTNNVTCPKCKVPLPITHPNTKGQRALIVE